MNTNHSSRPVVLKTSRPIARLSLAAACAAMLATHSGQGATIFWDGTGTGWDLPANWSTVLGADAPDPAAVPGAADIATFSATALAVAQAINLNGTQSALGLGTNNANIITTTLQGGGTNQTLNLGTSGISHLFGGLTIGSATAGQQVAISLQGSQTWTSSGANPGAAAILVNNGVSIGVGGNQTLTLTGTNTGARINGVVSDGAGVLSITKIGAGTWTLPAANSYSGVTTISAGNLNITNSGALGSMVGGTMVTGVAATLGISGNINVNEPLTLTGNGVATNTGALRSTSGNNTWSGNITTVNSSAGTARVAVDAGTLTISGNVSLSATVTDQFVLQGVGNGFVSGVISGASGVTRGSLGTGTWTLSGANTYTGRTVISSSTLSISSLNSVNGGTPLLASSSLGAPTTVASGTINMGSATAAGTLLYTGAGETTDRVLNFVGTTGGATLDQSGTGLLKFTSNLTVPGAAATDQRKTLTLQGSTAGSGEIAGNIVDATLGTAGQLTTTVTKAGGGTWTLSGANTYSGATNVNSGTLVVDLATNPGGVLPAATAVNMGISTLKVFGAGTGVSTQTIGSLTFTGTSMSIVVDPKGGTSTTLNITSPTLTAPANAQVNFNYGASTTNGLTVGNAVIAWSPALTNGLIGPGYLVTDAGGTGFATVSGGNVLRLVPALGLPQSGASNTENYTLNTNTSSSTPGSLNLVQTANQTINTLAVETAAASGTFALGATVLSLNAMTINGSSANTFVVSGPGGGIQAASAGGSLAIHNHAAGATTISAPVLDNVVSSLDINGTGALILSGANTYSGATNLNGGTTQFAGSMAGSPIVINGSAIAQFGNATGLTAGNSVTFGASSNGKLQLKGNSATIGQLTTNATTPGAAVVENASSTPATLTLTGTANAIYAGVIQDGSGGGALSLNVSNSASTLKLAGTAANTYTGLTTVDGAGVFGLDKTGVNAISGDVLIAGGRIMFSQSNQIADTATVTMSGGVFNGTGTNVGVLNINETIANLIVTGGSVNGGVGTLGWTVTGAVSFTGGAGNTIFVNNSGNQFSAGSLSLTAMTATAGGVVATNNSFSIYGNVATARSRFTVGSGGLSLNGSVLNLRQGTVAGAQGSRLVLDGNVSTSGVTASRIRLDTAGGTLGEVSVDLSSTAGTVTRDFDIAGGGADLTVDVAIVNGAATTASITKSGNGMLTLSGPNTYNGATTVNGGTLVVGGSIAGAVTVNAGASLGGSGSIAGLLDGSGSIAPGNSPGILTANSINPAGGLDFRFEFGQLNSPNYGNSIASGNDVLRLTSPGLTPFAGSFTAANVITADFSTLALNLGDKFRGGFFAVTNSQSDFATPLAGASYVFLGLSGDVTTFDVAVVGEIADFGAGAQNGYTLEFTAVPEPGSALSLLGGLGMLAGLRRFRRTFDSV
jgi:autotransporter-associated beta strand protein